MLRVDVALLMSLLAEADAVLRSYPVFLRVPWLTREGIRGYLHVETVSYTHLTLPTILRV